MHSVLRGRLSPLNKAIAAVCMAAFVGCLSSEQPPLTLFAASSLQAPLEEIHPQWSSKTNIPVRIHYASSSTLARQIELGAKADLLLSASSAWVNQLCQQSQINCSTRREMFQNRIAVLGKTQKPITSLKKFLLEQPCVTIGDWEHVPAGIYVKEALENLGIWSALKPKLVPAKDASTAFRMMLHEACPVNLGYTNLATVSPIASVIAAFPPSSYSPIQYESIQGSQRPHTLASEFQEFLSTVPAQAIFKNHGFLIGSQGRAQ